jgi:hypothetical protein
MGDAERCLTFNAHLCSPRNGDAPARAATVFQRQCVGNSDCSIFSGPSLDESSAGLCGVASAARRAACMLAAIRRRGWRRATTWRSSLQLALRHDARYASRKKRRAASERLCVKPVAMAVGMCGCKSLPLPWCRRWHPHTLSLQHCRSAACEGRALCSPRGPERDGARARALFEESRSCSRAPHRCCCCSACALLHRPLILALARGPLGLPHSCADGAHAHARRAARLRLLRCSLLLCFMARCLPHASPCRPLALALEPLGAASSVRVRTRRAAAAAALLASF